MEVKATGLTAGTEYTITEKEHLKSPKLFRGIVWGIMVVVYSIIFILLTITLTVIVIKTYNTLFLPYDYYTFLDWKINLYPISITHALFLGMVLSVIALTFILLLARLLIKIALDLTQWWDNWVIILYHRNLLRFVGQELLTTKQTMELIGLKLFKISTLFLPISMLFLIFDTLFQTVIFFPIYTLNLIILLFAIGLMISPELVIPNIEKEIKLMKERDEKLNKRKSGGKTDE